MKKIIAINASPRASWNTAQLVREAAMGAEAEGAEVKIFDLYKLEKFTGCISCFGCKLPEHQGCCVYRDGLTPVLFIMTSNCAEEMYSQIGYDKMLENYRNTLSGMVGPTKIMVSGDTLQVSDYSKYNWTYFDPEAKKARHDEVFPKELEKARGLGAQIVKSPWA